MAEQQDPEIPDVPEHDLSEEDMMFVSLLSQFRHTSFLYNCLYILFSYESYIILICKPEYMIFICAVSYEIYII